MISRVLLTTALLVILALVVYVMGPFLTAIAWAAILAYVSWPLYSRLQGVMPGHANLSALVMTSALAALIVLPLALIGVLAEMELVTAYDAIRTESDQAALQLPAALQNVPWLSEALQTWLSAHTAGPGWLSSLVAEYAQRWAGELGPIVGGLGRNLLTLVFTLMTVFFILRPLFISGATRMPLLLTVFGVLGGATAFGLIGIFLGPVILALGLTVWREWLTAEAPVA